MKNTISFVLFIVLTVTAFGAVSINAQKSQKLNSTPKTFQVFYAKFRTAVVRRNKNAVARVTRFPFQYGWDAGDEGTYNRRQFLEKYNDIFRDARKLFSQSNPTFYVNGNSFGLTNEDDASHYGFVRKGSTYYFVSFIVEP